MRTRFFAPVATGRYTLNQEGTILEEYVDFEILEILLLRLFVRVEGVVWERPLAHGGGQGLDQSDDQVDHLARLLRHHSHLVRVVTPGQRSDHCSHNWLQRADSVALVDARAGAAGHGQEELEAEVGDVAQGEGVLPVQVDSLNSVSLAGPSGACKGVNDEGGELHGNFDDGAPC